MYFITGKESKSFQCNRCWRGITGRCNPEEIYNLLLRIRNGICYKNDKQI